MVQAQPIDTHTDQKTILIVDDDDITLRLLRDVATRLGYAVLLAENGMEALEIVVEMPPDLIILDLMLPGMNGMELLKRLRSHEDTAAIPIIMVTASSEQKNMFESWDLGADDYIFKPFQLKVLEARINAILARSTVLRAQPSDPNIEMGIYRWQAFLSEVEREKLRTKKRDATNTYLVCIQLYELDHLLELLGDSIMGTLTKQIQAQILLNQQPLEILSVDDKHRFYLLMPETSFKAAKARLEKLIRQLSRFDFIIKNERARFTPVVGFSRLDKQLKVTQSLNNTEQALQDALSQLDLDPKYYLSSTQKRITDWLPNIGQLWQTLRSFFYLRFLKDRSRSAFQVVTTFFIGNGLPLMVYLGLGAVGMDITGVVYIGVVTALLLTAMLIWYEGYLAMKREPLPEAKAQFPLASAIIAAYLPNEADTLLATIAAFQHLEYPGPIQIILAYNTPQDMPFEETLQAIARRDPRFQPIRVKHSTSKAQNVNAALQHVTGEFVGIFDADHQPAPDTFTRAWQWLSQGYDVVQGHCLIRNGSASWVTRLVAVEFEAIYAVSHPGRAQMHGFGIFGGSNGYWRTDLLQSTRMQGFMLTEDIDSSMRITKQGFRIKVDPQIISRELAPTTPKALWTQRMRWAQGWFQVSLKHAIQLLLSPTGSLRQKMGIWHLIIWREIYPWVSMQIIPVVIYWAIRNGGFHNINWAVPIFIVTSIVTLSTGPLQIYFIYRLGHPSIKAHKRWFVFYVLMSFFYTEYKNTIARVSQLKEFMKDREWKVTSRG